MIFFFFLNFSVYLDMVSILRIVMYYFKIVGTLSGNFQVSL